ncbi:MAG: glycosyltransferase [Sedimentisphaerales bacterium]|nr:glycosyltransferase [Sedimentisphaerales bacterium]
MNNPDAGKLAVLIFRKRLLPPSQTFVVTPARSFATFRPVFVGLLKEQAGWHLVEPYPTALLSQFRPFWFHRLLLKLAGRPASVWVNAIKAYRPAIVHAQFGWDGMQALHLAKALAVPLVVHLRGSDIMRVDASRRYIRDRRRLYREAQAIIAVSQFVRSRLIQDGCPDGKIVVHYDGIDTDFWQPAGNPRPGRICFVGRLVEWKGCQHLIRAAAILLSKGHQIELGVVGDGPMREYLHELSRSLGLQVQFTGMLPPDQVRDQLGRSWVCCVPSIVLPDGSCEGLGNVSLEAQACGVPVVVGQSGGLPETIVDGQTGLVVDAQDDQLLARAISGLLTDPARRNKMSQAARDHVLARFNLALQAKRLEDLYERLIAEHGHSTKQKLMEMSHDEGN